MNSFNARQFVLWRKEKRVIISEDDLESGKIARIFKVKEDTLYIEDDFTRIARFPNRANGTFNSVFWEDRLSFQVLGESIEDDVPASNMTFSPSQLGIPRPGTSSSWQKPSAPVFGKSASQTKTKSGFQRVVFLAEFDADLKLRKTHTAYLKLTKETCDVNQAAKLTKEYLNLDEDLIIVDVHGYELMDNESTRQEDFWMAQTRKVFAVRLSDYEDAKKKRDRESVKARSKKGKRKAEQAFVDGDLLEELSNKIDKLVEKNEQKDIIEKSILDSFKCCICLKVVSKVIIATCCKRIIGCQSCIDQWFADKDCCPMCKAANSKDKVFLLKGMDEFTAVVSGLDG